MGLRILQNTLVHFTVCSNAILTHTNVGGWGMASVLQKLLTLF